MSDNFFNINSSIRELERQALEKSLPHFCKVEEITEYNQNKVLSSFIKNRVSESHFVPSTGYGYGDRGRDTLEKVFAHAFGAQDALVRHSFASGTHALATALFGVLRPGDKLLCITGTPYDTIHPVIGLTGHGQGSLGDFGIAYEQIDLLQSGCIDETAVQKSVESKDVKVVYLQRSRGYSLRNTLSVSSIQKISDKIKDINNKVIIMVDNCYGEFTEKLEPTQAGADLIVGSLIKNPGGGIAKTGGYIAGRKDLIELCSYRMTTAGLGREVGASIGETRNMFMGFFNAPHVTGEALRTAVFSSALFELMGFDVSPVCGEERYDIIQMIKLGDERLLHAFCSGLQSGAPIDSFVTPQASEMPGYDSKVIMSAGAFTAGSSIELSADAPLREPFAVWLQGGLNFHSAKTAVLLAAQEVLEKMMNLEGKY
ncbi:MAG: methionine gamma-lyase family protein [Oscillospiraceae bacterium]|nr:methionine gamma-lyase family protein [Oscillospiraceae bacterium]